MRYCYLLLVLLLVAACRPSAAPDVFSATLPPTQGAIRQSSAVTAVPTINRQPTSTHTLTATLTPSSTPTDVPTNTPRPTQPITAIPINTSVPNSTITPGGTPTSTWTPPPPDPATQLDDHYRMRRPIGSDGTNWVDRTYPYGGTQGGSLQTHLGVEFINPRGTPVLAVADGTVIHAGDDNSVQFGPSVAYYGKLVVIQHDFQAPDGQPVFSLYGHLDAWNVEAGQRVAQGDQIGVIGATGVAYGPHLHFEVRVGNAQDWNSTRNPELWISPFTRFGTLAGRVTDADGNVLYDAPIQVRAPTLARYAFSYADDTVNPDPVFRENFTLGDLPANYYEVSVTADGQVRFRKWIYVYPNRTTWIDVVLN